MHETPGPHRLPGCRSAVSDRGHRAQVTTTRGLESGGSSRARGPGEGRAESDIIRGVQTCMGSPSAAPAGRIAWREQRQRGTPQTMWRRELGSGSSASVVRGLRWRKGGAGDHSPPIATPPAPEPAPAPNTSVAHAAGP